jgi:hypothetical protein
MRHSIESRRPAPRKRATVLAALVLLLACSEPAGPERQGQLGPTGPAAAGSSGPSGELAVHADRFVDAISVQTHLGHQSIYSTSWSTIVRPRLLELGIRHVRERMFDSETVQSRMKELAANGIKLTAGCWPIGTNYSNASHCVARANAYGANTIDAFDGWNEVDNKGSNWPAAWTAWQAALWNAYKEHATWRSRPLYANSLARAKSASDLGDRSSILDYGNMHSYPAGNMPSVVSDAWIPAWNRVASPKPLVVTETGYHTCTTCTKWNGVSLLAGGKYHPRLLFEYWNRGVKRTNLFELIDVGTSTTERRDNFGLLKNNGTPKPAFTAIKNLIALLSDEGSAFTPGRLEYGLSGALASTHKTLLQKRDGRFYLALWQEVKSWDNNTKKDVTSANDAVTLTLGQAASSLKVFQPRTSTLPIQTGRGTSIALSVPDEVIVVEVTP